MIDDHPQRYALVNELHARPFPSLEVPCHAVYVAVKQPVDAHNRDREDDRAHLLALLDRHGAAHPPEGATHHAARIGRHDLKWESHTEFVAYSAFGRGVSDRAFGLVETEVFPSDWLVRAPGRRVAAILIRIQPLPDDLERVKADLEDWFVPESLACSWVLDQTAIIAGDFQIDPAGQMRFAIFVRPDTGARRVGRIVQRLCEIETYRAMSMLGLGRARELNARLNALDPQLSDLVAAMSDTERNSEDTLHELLAIAADLEAQAARHAFRFGATGAYEALVNQRVQVLREPRFNGRQTFAEFMMRRYDPAMRTVKSAERRLEQMAARAERAGELLRTRVDVERSAQNQKLLESMDRRADLALRLQHTVEGLSVVAISYYAVNLAVYLLAPLADRMHWQKPALVAALVPVVMLAVWLMVRRIRKSMH
ncbi:hypothetical protein DEA8626_02116 [Defluviimonas aquaemixtae]|uniref:DUF3422 domain-containing protein n=1 Tax=Albidovulum aquaemixtae TaxID=1542388 RepID=A0A2R8B7L3_9RHOB|nr:DUF3422 domain-containing protein [Defluviimonas aquaemixtae]SPH18576.1 hypothetical protein DEA8626_02116 [Defluviimonas aquaemixtae]